MSFRENEDRERDRDIDRKLGRILELLETLTNQGEHVLMDLTALTADVTNTTTVEESAITLLNGLGAQLQQIAGDPAAVAALGDQLNTEAANLAAAVTANTPAAPAA